MFKKKKSDQNSEVKDKKTKAITRKKNSNIAKNVENFIKADDQVVEKPRFSYKHGFNKLTKGFAILIVLTTIMISYFSYVRYKILLQRIDNEVIISANQVENVFVDYANIAEMLLMHINHQMINNDVFRVNTKIANVLTTFNDDTKVINSLGNNLIAGGMFYWIDNKKNLIASSNGLVSKAINLSSRDYLIKTEKLPLRVQVGSPVIGALSGQSIIPMALGIHNLNGEFAGTIVLSLRLDNFLNRFRNLKERDIEFAILDQSNGIIMSSSEEMFRKKIEKIANSQINDDGIMIENFSLFNLSNQVIFVKQVSNQPYKIITAMRTKNAYKTISREMLPNIIEICLIIIFLITTKIIYRLALFPNRSK